MKFTLLRAENPTLVQQRETRKQNVTNAYGNPHKGWVHNACRYITPDQARQNEFTNFTVVGDPIRRVLSMYHNLLRRPKRSLEGVSAGSKRFRKSIEAWFETPTLLNFLDLLKKYPDEERNIHFRSQKGHCLLNDIVKVDIAKLSSTIQQIHPLLVVDDQLNKTTYTYERPDDFTLNRIHQVFDGDFKLLDECI